MAGVVIGTAYADLSCMSARCGLGVKVKGKGRAAYRGGDVGRAHVADILDAALGAPRARLLLDDAHGLSSKRTSAGGAVADQMGCNAGLGRGGHAIAMVTRQAAAGEAELSQAAQDVDVNVRVSFHSQRMRNNSGSSSDSNNSNRVSAWTGARAVAWGATSTLPSTVVCGRDASPNQIGPPTPGSALRGET